LVVSLLVLYLHCECYRCLLIQNIIFHLFAEKPPMDGFASKLVLGFSSRMLSAVTNFIAIGLGVSIL